MSRYFNSNGDSRSHDNRPSTSRIGKPYGKLIEQQIRTFINFHNFRLNFNQMLDRIYLLLVLPEFIPFGDDFAKDQNDKNSLLPPQSRQETRSPKQHSDRDSERSSGSRFSDQRMSHENGSNKASPRNAYRSPQKAEIRRPSPQRRASPQRVRINRHNSPQRPKRISPPRGRDTRQDSGSRNRSRSRENDNHFERGESRGRIRDRLSNEPHGSVFDRMSSPPPHPVRRRFRDTRSREDSNGPPTHFYRTIDGSNSTNARYVELELEEVARQNNHPNFDRYHRDSPIDFPKRYAMGPDEIRGIQAAGISRQREDSLEFRDLRERLLAAEAHCHGLETTVRSYHREIVKLRSIVNEIISDFEVLQNSR